MQAPSTEALLTQWNWEPTVIIGVAILSAGYAYAIGPLRRRRDLGPPVRRVQIVLFILAQITLLLALISPLDAIGDTYLFSGHMVQHLLLATFWPPLVLIATPGWLLRPLFRTRATGQLALFLTYPAVAILLFNLDIYLWHVPGAYDLTLTNGWVHIAEHMTFMAFGLINWWPVLSSISEQRLSYPLQILYLFADGMFMMVLGILFTFAPTVFYAPYLSAPRLWDISPLTDQQLGGLIMWYPGNLPYGVLLVIAFYRWFDGDEPASSSQSSFTGSHLT